MYEFFDQLILGVWIMKKVFFTAMLTAVMVFTGCSASGNGALPDNKKNDPAAAEIAERTMQLSASAEAESEIDRQLLPYLDKAFYGAILKAIGEDQTVNYMISDIDGDGAQELAVTSYFDGNTANSCMLFKNALDYYMYYDPGIYGGDIWHKFRYDRNTDSLLWAVGSIAKDDTCSRYYSLSGGRWTMNSIMSGDANENSDKEGSCILNDEYATKQEFVSYSQELVDPYEKDDVFNVRTRSELKKTASEFKKYLKVSYEPSMIGFTDKNTGNMCYIITIDDILLNYRCLPFIEYEETDDISDEYIKTILRAKTICFVLDETGSGTRIRCQIFDKKTVFNKGSAGVTANISGELSKVTISPEGSDMTRDFITLE